MADNRPDRDVIRARILAMKAKQDGERMRTFGIFGKSNGVCIATNSPSPEPRKLAAGYENKADSPAPSLQPRPSLPVSVEDLKQAKRYRAS